jgi:tripartite-type tricarboxylate transporter receptor subunit TctC
MIFYLSDVYVEVNQVLATDSMRSWLDKQGMVAVGGTPDDFKRQIAADYQSRGELVRALGITGE